MPQKALRREDDERERIGVEQRSLPAEDVKVLRGRRAVDEPQIGVGRQLQEPLRTRAGVVGSLPFVRMRQEEDE